MTKNESHDPLLSQHVLPKEDRICGKLGYKPAVETLVNVAAAKDYSICRPMDIGGERDTAVNWSMTKLILELWKKGLR